MPAQSIRTATLDDLGRIKSIAVAARVHPGRRRVLRGRLDAGQQVACPRGSRRRGTAATYYAFYRNLGYGEEARVRQFYGPDDDKVMFWKSLIA